MLYEDTARVRAARRAHQSGAIRVTGLLRIWGLDWRRPTNPGLTRGVARGGSHEKPCIDSDSDRLGWSPLLKFWIDHIEMRRHCSGADQTAGRSMRGLIDRMRQWSIVGSVGPLHGPGRQRSHAIAACQVQKMNPREPMVSSPKA